MNRMFFINISALLIGYFLGNAIASAADKPEEKCYPNKEFMQYIQDNHLVTVYGGETTTGKRQELMISNDRRAIVVEYDKTKDGNALTAEKYCVTGVTHDVTFNDSAIEFLSKLLDKVRGQKV
jgi:hypothetical protein